jgi:hypothetical protein
MLPYAYVLWGILERISEHIGIAKRTTRITNIFRRLVYKYHLTQSSKRYPEDVARWVYVDLGVGNCQVPPYGGRAHGEALHETRFSGRVCGSFASLALAPDAREISTSVRIATLPPLAVIAQSPGYRLTFSILMLTRAIM